jgi:type I restriction-modification system DNA methylase subunit
MAVLGTTQMALRLSDSVLSAGVLKQLIKRAIEQKPSSIDVLELPGGTGTLRQAQAAIFAINKWGHSALMLILH